MPIYEYECKDHGKFEMIFQYIPKEFPKVNCMIDDSCDNIAELQISLCTMKPDSHWNGTVLPNGKLVTNSKEYKDATANWETISDASQASTKQRKREKEKETKQRIEKQVEQFVNQELAGVSF